MATPTCVLMIAVILARSASDYKTRFTAIWLVIVLVFVLQGEPNIWDAAQARIIKELQKMTIIQELIAIIETKNSWGKNELLKELLGLLARHYK
jgi:hypothetical protein